MGWIIAVGSLIGDFFSSFSTNVGGSMSRIMRSAYAWGVEYWWAIIIFVLVFMVIKRVIYEPRL